MSKRDPLEEASGHTQPVSHSQIVDASMDVDAIEQVDSDLLEPVESDGVEVEQASAPSELPTPGPDEPVAEDSNVADLMSLLTEGAASDMTPLPASEPVYASEADDASGIIAVDDPIDEDIVEAATEARAEAERRNAGRWLVVTLIVLALLGAGGYGYYWNKKQNQIAALKQEIKKSFAVGRAEALRKAASAADQLAQLTDEPEPAGQAGYARALLALEYGEGNPKAPTGATPWHRAATVLIALLDGKDKVLSAADAEKPPLSFVRARQLGLRWQTSPTAYDEAVQAHRAALSGGMQGTLCAIRLAELVGRKANGFDAAKELLGRVLKQHPEHEEAQLVLAQLLSRSGKDLSRVDKLIASVLAGKTSSIQQSRTHLVRAMKARANGKLKEMSTALQQAEAALAKTEVRHAATTWAIIGREYAALYRTEDAARAFDQALKGRQDPGIARDRAEAALRIGDFAGAASVLESNKATDSETRLLQGRLLRLQGKNDHARRILGDAISGAQGGVVSMLKVEQALVDSAQGRYMAARRVLRDVAAQPGQTDVLFQAKGRVHLAAGKLNRAEKALKQAWRLNKLDPITPSLLGWVSLARSDLAKAESRFARALKNNKVHLDARLGLAAVALARTDVAAARKIIDGLPVSQQQRPAAQIWKIRAGLAAGNKVTINDALKRQLDPATLGYLEGERLLHFGDASEAYTRLKQGEKRYGGQVRFLMVIAEAAAAAGKLSDAQTYVARLLSSSPKSARGLVMRAELVLRQADVNGAMAIVTKVLAMPELPSSIAVRAHSIKAEIYLRKRDTGRAMAELEDATKRSSKAPRALFVLGQVYDRVDRPARSANYYRQAIKAGFRGRAINRRLGEVLIKAGDKKAAKAAFKRYLKLNPNAADRFRVKRKMLKIR